MMQLVWVLVSCYVIALVQHYLMWTAPSMTPLHSLGQVDQNDIQVDYFGHVTPLGPALASCDADSVVNGTTAFLSSRQLK